MATPPPRRPADAAGAAAGTAVDADAAHLESLGYKQELKRSLSVFGNIAMGFATVSPVVGLYAVVQVGVVVAGPAWVWALPVVFLLQALVVCVYAELAADFPVAGGAYQWTRRLIGPKYAWIVGWITVCALFFAHTTIAYLASPWFFALFGWTPTPAKVVAVAAVFLAVCALINAYGIDVLKRVVDLGIAAEAVASVLVGVGLLLLFREHGFSILTDTFGAEALSGGSKPLAFLAALAVAGWAFVGFDACVAMAEETVGAARQVPRALWWAFLSVGGLVILNAVAVDLAHPDPTTIMTGSDLDPVTTAVVASFGDWSAKPFIVVVIIAFIACELASQGGGARALYSMARDGVLPASRTLGKVNRRQVPLAALAVDLVVSCLALLLGLEASAIGSIITFGSAALYLTFLAIAFAALVARIRGTWVPAGIRLGRFGLVVNIAAVLWLAFEFVNIAWPRTLLAPPDAPAYQVWAAVIGVVLVLGTGLAYLAAARPHRALEAAARTADAERAAAAADPHQTTPAPTGS
ncbi:APC family permease [Yinghuangia seranimata]|uniref:APC family permease n=1 Tax=Yinghuangia seranimata TaxID=408067 RepID=UPI00248BC738|nr:APC family permease [Yinghuangia seranimata]MDI2126019.1 APC family permease [Yinghuangia seranimata]